VGLTCVKHKQWLRVSGVGVRVWGRHVVAPSLVSGVGLTSGVGVRVWGGHVVGSRVIKKKGFGVREWGGHVVGVGIVAEPDDVWPHFRVVVPL